MALESTGCGPRRGPGLILQSCMGLSTGGMICLHAASSGVGATNVSRPAAGL
jgi:hypothetical protein